MTDHFTNALPDSCFLNRYFCDHSGPHYVIVFFKNTCKKTCRTFQPKFAKRWKVFPLYSIWSVQYSTFRTNFLQYLLHNISFFKSQKTKCLVPKWIKYKFNLVPLSCIPLHHHWQHLHLPANDFKWGHTAIHTSALSSLPYRWWQEQIKIYIYIYLLYILYIFIFIYYNGYKLQ